MGPCQSNFPWAERNVKISCAFAYVPWWSSTRVGSQRWSAPGLTFAARPQPRLLRTLLWCSSVVLCVNFINLKSLPDFGKLFRIIGFTFAFTGLSFDCAGATCAPNGPCSPATPQHNRFAAPQHDRDAPQKPAQQPWLRPCSKGVPWCGPSLAACRFASIAGPPLAKREIGCWQLCWNVLMLNNHCQGPETAH